MRLPDPREVPLLTVAETATIMHESEKVIRREIANGHLPSIRVGRYVRVVTASLYELFGLPLSQATAARPPASSAHRASAPHDQSMTGGPRGWI